MNEYELRYDIPPGQKSYPLSKLTRALRSFILRVQRLIRSLRSFVLAFRCFVPSHRSLDFMLRS